MITLEQELESNPYPSPETEVIGVDIETEQGLELELPERVVSTDYDPTILHDDESEFLLITVGTQPQLIRRREIEPSTIEVLEHLSDIDDPDVAKLITEALPELPPTNIPTDIAESLMTHGIAVEIQPDESFQVYQRINATDVTETELTFSLPSDEVQNPTPEAEVQRLTSEPVAVIKIEETKATFGNEYEYTLQLVKTEHGNFELHFNGKPFEVTNPAIIEAIIEQLLTDGRMDETEDSEDLGFRRETNYRLLGDPTVLEVGQSLEVLVQSRMIELVAPLEYPDTTDETSNNAGQQMPVGINISTDSSEEEPLSIIEVDTALPSPESPFSDWLFTDEGPLSYMTTSDTLNPLNLHKSIQAEQVDALIALTLMPEPTLISIEQAIANSDPMHLSTRPHINHNSTLYKSEEQPEELSQLVNQLIVVQQSKEIPVVVTRELQISALPAEHLSELPEHPEPIIRPALPNEDRVATIRTAPQHTVPIPQEISRITIQKANVEYVDTSPMIKQSRRISGPKPPKSPPKQYVPMPTSLAMRNNAQADIRHQRNELRIVKANAVVESTAQDNQAMSTVEASVAQAAKDQVQTIRHEKRTEKRATISTRKEARFVRSERRVSMQEERFSGKEREAIATHRASITTQQQQVASAHQNHHHHQRERRRSSGKQQANRHQQQNLAQGEVETALSLFQSFHSQFESRSRFANISSAIELRALSNGTLLREQIRPLSQFYQRLGTGVAQTPGLSSVRVVIDEDQVSIQRTNDDIVSFMKLVDSIGQHSFQLRRAK